MPMFKILVTPKELDVLVREYPELVNKTSIDGCAEAQIQPPESISDDGWTPANPWLKSRYKKLKERFV